MTAASQGTVGTGPRRLRPVIAIDGPAGAGKSTLAAHLARRFGFLNLETGAMYRALALKALNTHTPLNDEAALAGLTDHTRILLEPAAVQQLHAFGNEPAPTSPDEFKKRIEADIARWSAVDEQIHFEKI